MIVKICGITTSDDARAALDAGADWIGLNLVAGPRKIDEPQLKSIVSKLDDVAPVVALIALRGDESSLSQIGRLRDQVIRRFQLYGQVDAKTVASLIDAKAEWLLVGPVAGDADLVSLERKLEAFGQRQPDYLLFDASSPEKLGGTGQEANWESLQRACESGRYDHWPPVILAGGLTPVNVADAIRVVRPAGVDVSSGVESTPGRKDPAKVQAFVTAAREAARHID